MKTFINAFVIFVSFFSLAARAESGEHRYFRAILQNESGMELNLFGEIPQAHTKPVMDFFHKNEKQNKPEMFDVYRYAYDGESKDRVLTRFHKIGEGFALGENDIAVKLDAAHSDLARSQKNFINVQPKDKSALVFFKKNVLSEALASDLKNPELRKAIEGSSLFAFYPLDTEPTPHLSK